MEIVMKVISPSSLLNSAFQLIAFCRRSLESKLIARGITQGRHPGKLSWTATGRDAVFDFRGLAQNLQISVLFAIGFCLIQAPAQAQTAHFSWAQVTLANTGFDSFGQVAVDASENVYFVDSTGGSGVVKEILAAGGYTKVNILGGGFIVPQGVAVDSSGNVFVADEGTGYSGSAVYKIPPGCATSSCVLTLGGGFAFFEPAGVAVDGNGNVFVADLFGPVYEIPASGSVKTFNCGFSIPQGVAVDGSGNIFVADTGNNAVKEIPAGCTSSSCVKSLGGGFSQPDGVAADGNGNVFVADTDNNILKEIPANCVTSTCVKPMGMGFFEPYGLAVDASGNIFSGFSSSSTLVKLYPGVVDFGTLAVGKTSTAIPLTFTFDSAGTLGSWATGGLDFVNAGTGTCKTGTFFNAGRLCKSMSNSGSGLGEATRPTRRTAEKMARNRSGCSGWCGPVS